MGSNIKEQLIKSVKNIKNKLKQMREEEENLDLQHRKLFKPITEPLEAVVNLKNKNMCDQNNIETLREKFDDTKSPPYNESDCDMNEAERSSSKENFSTPMKSEPNHENKLFTSTPTAQHPQNKALNVAYGVRNEQNKLMIGNAMATLKTFDSSERISMITINNKSYEMTSGLSELLFENKPDLKKISEKDKLTYKDILLLTNAHKRGFLSSGQIQGNSGMKYCKIIKPLFNEQDIVNIKEGGSLKALKKYKSNTDLVYWDDANELIDRLKILLASKKAGNTNHDNEIISIIEELKEAGIIKN